MDNAVNEGMPERRQITGAKDRYLKWRPSVAEITLGMAVSGASGICAYWEKVPWAIAIPLMLLSFIIGVMTVRIVKVPALGHSFATEYAIPWAHVGAVVVLTIALVALIRSAPAEDAKVIIAPRFYRNKQVATRTELKSSITTNRVVYVADIPLIDGAIKGKIFTDCHIIGPAVLAPGDRFQMIDMGFLNSTNSSPLFIVDMPRNGGGIVRVDNSIFSGCNLENVGFAGSTKVIDYVKGRLRPSQ